MAIFSLPPSAHQQQTDSKEEGPLHETKDETMVLYSSVRPQSHLMVCSIQIRGTNDNVTHVACLGTEEANRHRRLNRLSKSQEASVNSQGFLRTDSTAAAGRGFVPPPPSLVLGTIKCRASSPPRRPARWLATRSAKESDQIHATKKPSTARCALDCPGHATVHDVLRGLPWVPRG